MASGATMVYETSSCQMCPNVYTCDMVQCDSCDLWYHFVCVGVTRTIASKDWDCDRCKYALPENPFFDKYEKENRPPEIRWRKTQSIASLSSVSSRRNSVLALKKLEEERALREKRDHEYLQQKYSILEDLIDDSGEHRTKDQIFDDKQSFENTLQWANEMQNLSEDYANKFKVNDISISFDEDERTAMNQRFFPLAQSSTNVRRPKSGLSSENDGKTSVPATQQKPLDPSVSEFEQLRSKLFEDSAKTTINTVGAASSTELPRQCTNPFIDSNNFRFNETEVLSAKPLQSKLIDNKLKSTFNVIDSSESLLGGVRRRELRTNFIQPSKLQLNKKAIQQLENCEPIRFRRRNCNFKINRIWVELKSIQLFQKLDQMLNSTTTINGSHMISSNLILAQKISHTTSSGRKLISIDSDFQKSNHRY